MPRDKALSSAEVCNIPHGKPMCNVEHMYMQAQSQMPALISFRRFSNPPPLQKKNVLSL